MKFLNAFLLTMIFLVTGIANAAFLPPIDTLTIGGRLLTNQTNLKILGCHADVLLSSTCVLGSGVAGYQVPAGKTFTIKAIEISSNNASASATVVYTDNDNGTNNSAAGWVNAVAAYNNQFGNALVASGTALYTAVPYAFDWAIPTGKFVTMQSTNSAGIAVYMKVYGYEQ
jgi:hypothetical protein